MFKKIIFYLKTLKKEFFIIIGNSLPKFGFFNIYIAYFYKVSKLNIESSVTITGPILLRPDSGYNIFIGGNTYFNSETRFGVKDS